MAELRRKATIGTILLVAVMLLVFFDPLVAALKWLVNAFAWLNAPFINATRTGPFSRFGGFASATWQWLGYVFTTPIALAAVIVISLIYEAMETRWR